MSSIIRIKRGTRSQLNALAIKRGLLEGEPLLITDEGRLGIATSTSTYQAFAKEGEVGVGVQWGDISGSISNQSDLQTELNNIYAAMSGTTSSFARSFALMGV